MPHKKAKRSVREEQQKQQGSNLAPGKDPVSNEAIPKSAARVLNASQIREDYKKRKQEQGGSDDRNLKKRKKTDDVQLKIKPGEAIQHFYRRVEDDMRPIVRSAFESSKAVERKERNADFEFRKKNATQSHKSKPSGSSVGKEPPGQLPPQSFPESARKGPKAIDATEFPKDFAKISTSAPRRLNDIAQAPPDIRKFPRNILKMNAPKREGVLSMAQKSLMEQEREKAIARYRMLKATRQPRTEHD